LKISFPKYGPGELLIKARGAPWIISSVIIAFFAGLCVSYLLANKFWLLTIALVGIAGILLCLGAAARIFLNSSKVEEAPTANIKENVPRITSQWAYRPKKPIRGPAVFDSPSAETSEVLSPDPFGINNNVWCNDNSLEGAAPAFINPRPNAEKLMTKVLSQMTDIVRTAPTANDAAVSTYD
jgi:hypothetical protein